MLLLSLPQAAQAQVWTEADVTALATERAPEVRAAQARARIQRARAQTSGLRPNPTVEYERQQTFQPNAQAQDLARLFIPLALSGRLGTQRALAEVEAAFADARAAATRGQAAEMALSAFYRALALERSARLRRRAHEALAEALRVMRSRAAAGEVSGYAASRMAVEDELSRSRWAEARVMAGVARTELAALLGAETPEGLQGDFDVAAPPALGPLLDRAYALRPELRALEEAALAAGRANDSAAWAWIPQLTLFGGYDRQLGSRGVGAPPNIVGHGYSAGFAASIPLFQNGQAERAGASAARGAVDEQRAAIEARIAASVRAARERLAALIAERDRFARQSAAPVELLVRAATTGYRGGERSVVELLDARRAAVDASDRRVQLDLAVRLADVALRRATGELR